MKVRHAVVLSILFSMRLYGVTIDNPERRLVVRHSKPATVTVGEGAHAVSTALASTMSWTRRHDEVIRVVIDDPDPLVFTYKWQGLTKVQTEDYKAALAFADTVGGFGKTLSSFLPAKEGAQNAPANVSGTPQVGSRMRSILSDLGITTGDLTQVANDLVQLSDWAKKVPQLTSDSAQSKETAQSVKDQVMKWDLETTASRAQKTMSKLEAASDQLLLRLLTPQSTSSAPGASGSAGSNPSGSIGNMSLGTGGSAGNKSGTQGSVGTLGAGGANVSGTPQNTPLSQTAAATISDVDLGFAYLLATSKAQRVDDLVKSLRTFVSAAKQINEPIAFDPIDYSASEVVTGTLEIGAAAGADASDVAKRETGTFKFAMNPYTPAHLRNIAPAVVYSFVEAPQYSTKTLANGKFQIVRTDSGNAVNGLTMAAMLTLTPQSWSNPTVGGSFQVGLSPVKDRLAILGGATLNIYDLFSLGGGVIYQQAQRLAAGLHEGEDDLASADALKTTTHFKTGFYLSVTVKVK